MKKTIFTLLIISVLAFSLIGQTRKPRPVTVKGQTNVTAVKSAVEKKKTIRSAAEKKNTLGVSVERYVITTDVNADGTATQTLEMLQRLNSETAVEGFKKYERIFNADLERAEVLEAYVLKTDGAKIAVPAASIQIKPTAQAKPRRRFPR
jgi:hypothetical protein